MSYVTHLILHVQARHHPRRMREIDRFFDEIGRPPVSVGDMGEVDGKSWVAPIYIGAYNFFPLGKFIDHLKSLPWGFPDYAQLLVRDEGQQGFHVALEIAPKNPGLSEDEVIGQMLADHVEKMRRLEQMRRRNEELRRSAAPEEQRELPPVAARDDEESEAARLESLLLEEPPPIEGSWDSPFRLRHPAGSMPPEVPSPMSETSSSPAAVTFLSAFSIGDTEVSALPVKDIGPAVGYYVHVLGFTLSEKAADRATLTRDQVTIGLATNGSDPEQASVYFNVSDVEALRRELEGKGIEPSALRVDTHGGKRYRVFFAKEPYGVCFCFGQPAD